jgi:hypothetical protein
MSTGDTSGRGEKSSHARWFKIAVVVAVGVAIPVVRWLSPGERGPETFGETLIWIVGVTVGVAVLMALRHRSSSAATRAGRRLRERHGR